MTLAPFANEPVLELRRAVHREALLTALGDLDARLPVRVPVWIGGERRDGDSGLEHHGVPAGQARGDHPEGGSPAGSSTGRLACALRRRDPRPRGEAALSGRDRVAIALLPGEGNVAPC